jgi:hypothetical protein
MKTLFLEEKTMEEHTKNEQFQGLDEEQLQAITGAGSPNNNPVLDLHDQYLDHTIKGTVSHSLGDTTAADQHNQKAQAALEKLKTFYVNEDSQGAAASPKKTKSRLFCCFGR